MNILLFPGSFSPYTDGHYGIVSRYISAADEQGMKIDKIVIIISSKVREGIDTKSVFAFIKQLYSNDKRFEIILSGDGGPIKETFKYVNIHSKEEYNTYIFVRSSKDDDSVADSFNKRFGEGGDAHLDNVHIGNLEVSDAPIVYKNRDDQYKGKPISASVVREDLRNKDFELFKTSYQQILRSEVTITDKHLKRVFDIWSKEVTEKTEDSEKKLSESVNINTQNANQNIIQDKADDSVIEWNPKMVIDILKQQIFNPMGFTEWKDLDDLQDDNTYAIHDYEPPVPLRYDIIHNVETMYIEFGVKNENLFRLSFVNGGFLYPDYKSHILDHWMMCLTFDIDSSSNDLHIKFQDKPMIKNMIRNYNFYYDLNGDAVKKLIRVLKMLGLSLETRNVWDSVGNYSLETLIEFDVIGEGNTFPFQNLLPYIEDVDGGNTSFMYDYKYLRGNIEDRYKEFEDDEDF